MAEKTTFIRKNGKIIPIKGKDGMSPKKAQKAIKRSTRSLKAKNKSIEKRSLKAFGAGAIVGGIISKSRGTGALIVGTLAALIAGGGKEKRKNIHKMADNKAVGKLAKHYGKKK